MTDWIPEVAVISPERQTILDLIQLCKREMAYHRHVMTALNELANTGHSALSLQFADRIAQETVGSSGATAPTHEDFLFRPVVSDLMHGREYLQSLQAVLSKQL